MKYNFLFALALLLFVHSCKDEPPVKPVLPTPDPEPTLVYDTTSHNITWFADTLGDYGQELNDIWAADSVSFYAVGKINISSNPNRPWRSIVKWNGSQWVDVPNIGYGESNELGGIGRAIFGFGNNNIWVAKVLRMTNGATAAIEGFPFSHYNGVEWKTYYAPPPSPSNLYSSNRYIYDMWGSDPNHLWAVGDSGLIYFWNGSVWRKQTVPQIVIDKAFDLNRVSGVSHNEVYAFGYNTFAETVMLRLNGGIWEVVYLSRHLTSGQPSYLGNLHYGEWQMGNKVEKRLWLFADNLYEWDRTVFPAMNWIPVEGFRLQGYGGGIASTKGSNVWVTNRKKMAHWNGVSWKKYDDVAPHLPANIFFERIAAKGKTVVAVGFNFDSFSRPYYLIGRQE